MCLALLWEGPMSVEDLVDMVEFVMSVSVYYLVISVCFKILE